MLEKNRPMQEGLPARWNDCRRQGAGRGLSLMEILKKNRQIMLSCNVNVIVIHYWSGSVL